MGDFGTVDYVKMSQIGHWSRAIKKMAPSFETEFVRSNGNIQYATITGNPMTRTDARTNRNTQRFDTFEKFFKSMGEIARYCQVEDAGRTRVRPPPLWLCEEAVNFWERAAVGDVERGLYRRRFGNRFYININLSNGAPWTAETREQLVWVLRERDRVIFEAFHYLTPSVFEQFAGHSDILERAVADWNASMYHYIELDLIRPSTARSKLAGLNRELHKKMIQLFFGKTAKAGAVKRAGGLVHDVLIKSIKSTHKPVHDWYQDWVQP
ncbi:MAG: hypothetical protein AAGB11_15550 [Pseudomonadota bacterium]